MLCGLWLLCFSFGTSLAFAQASKVEPRIVSETDLEGRVTVVEVAARYVTAIRLPEAVNSVVVGDPSTFQVQHSGGEEKSTGRFQFKPEINMCPIWTITLSTANQQQANFASARCRNQKVRLRWLR